MNDTFTELVHDTANRLGITTAETVEYLHKLITATLPTVRFEVYLRKIGA